MASQEKKKITLRERKKAQPGAKIYFSTAERDSIKEMVAKDLDRSQTAIYFYQCQALGLNPLLNEIAAITYKTKQEDGTYEKKMSIQLMRDGFLTIAHRSGKFAGLESGVTVDDNGKIICGWAKVYHKDFIVPLYQEADFEEYNAPTRNMLWQTKPKTMIKKVAESMALRKAFNVSGVYAPEEMERELVQNQVVKEPLKLVDGDKPATKEQKATIEALDPKKETKSFDHLTKQEAADILSELTTKK